MRTHIRLGKLEGLLQYEKLHPTTEPNPELPYRISRSETKYVVRRKSDNKLIGTHDTRADARTQILALIVKKKCG